MKLTTLPSSGGEKPRMSFNGGTTENSKSTTAHTNEREGLSHDDEF
jgi:hypothetical protein